MCLVPGDIRQNGSGIEAAKHTQHRARLLPNEVVIRGQGIVKRLWVSLPAKLCKGVNVVDLSERVIAGRQGLKIRYCLLVFQRAES